MLPNPISSGQVDRKSPVDDILMESIKADLEYLDGAIAGANTEFTNFRWSGSWQDLFMANYSASNIRRVNTRMLGGPHVAKTQVLSSHSCFMEATGNRVGLGMQFDIRKFRPVSHDVLGWRSAWQINNKSENKNIPWRPFGGSQHVTDSEVVAGGQVAVQAISFFDSAKNITKAIGVQLPYPYLPADQRIVANQVPTITQDSDTSTGYIRLYLDAAISSLLPATGSNYGQISGSGITLVDSGLPLDGYYNIVRVPQNGIAYVEIPVTYLDSFTNLSAITGTFQWLALKVELSNPADSFAFVPGEKAALNGVTNGTTNSDNWSIVAINQQSGDNVIVSGLSDGTAYVTQGSPAGTLWSGRNVLLLDTALDTTAVPLDGYFTVNGNSFLKGVYQVADIDHAGNPTPNVVFKGTSVSGGVLTTVSSQNPQSGITAPLYSSMFVLDLSTSGILDPADYGIVVGDEIMFCNNLSGSNIQSSAKIRYQVLAVNDATYPLPNLRLDAKLRSSSYSGSFPRNTTVRLSSAKILIETQNDPSADFVAAKSRAMISSQFYYNFPSGEYDVLDVNAGPGTPKNIVVDFRPFIDLRFTGGSVIDFVNFAQGTYDYPFGRVLEESRSVFSTKPFIADVTSGPLSLSQNFERRAVAFSNGVLDSVEKSVNDGDVLGFQVSQTTLDANGNVSLETTIDGSLAVGMRIG